MDSTAVLLRRLATVLILGGSAVPAVRADDAAVIAVQGFVDAYYGVDFNDPAGGRRPDFLFNHTRDDRPRVNLALVAVSAQQERIRGNLGLMAGTYSKENLASEPRWARSIFEANVGVALDDAGSVWLDIGVLPSYIGFESAISSDNATLTRSLAAENSPYFVTGAQLGWDVTPALSAKAVIMNGWQRITRISGNSLPSLGTQLEYTPRDGVALNWSTFIGTDDPDATRRMRYFSNLYGVFDLSGSTQLIVGFDVGAQQKERGSGDYHRWWTPTAVLGHRIDERWSTAVRAEYYRDRKGVIVGTPNDVGMQTFGASWNLDWQASEPMLIRLEARWLRSPSAIFEREDSALARQSRSVLASVTFSF